MSAGEFDSGTKPSTPQYRDNWERIWGSMWRLAGELADMPEEEAAYPNGCPMLSSDE